MACGPCGNQLPKRKLLGYVVSRYEPVFKGTRIPLQYPGLVWEGVSESKIQEDSTFLSDFELPFAFHSHRGMD